MFGNINVIFKGMIIHTKQKVCVESLVAEYVGMSHFIFCWQVFFTFPPLKMFQAFMTGKYHSMAYLIYIKFTCKLSRPWSLSKFKLTAS